VREAAACRSGAGTSYPEIAKKRASRPRQQRGFWAVVVNRKPGGIALPLQPLNRASISMQIAVRSWRAHHQCGHQ